MIQESKKQIFLHWSPLSIVRTRLVVMLIRCVSSQFNRQVCLFINNIKEYPMIHGTVAVLLPCCQFYKFPPNARSSGKASSLGRIQFRCSGRKVNQQSLNWGNWVDKSLIKILNLLLNLVPGSSCFFRLVSGRNMLRAVILIAVASTVSAYPNGAPRCMYNPGGPHSSP